MYRSVRTQEVTSFCLIKKNKKKKNTGNKRDGQQRTNAETVLRQEDHRRAGKHSITMMISTASDKSFGLELFKRLKPNGFRW